MHKEHPCILSLGSSIIFAHLLYGLYDLVYTFSIIYT